MRISDALDPDEISQKLHTRYIGSKVLVYRSTTSTNDVAAEYAGNPKNHGLVVFAEEQTAGRGRNHSPWQSPAGQSLLCSILLVDSGINNGLLSVTSAVALAQAIESGPFVRPTIKWPNDVCLDGKKVAGILIESTSHPTHKTCIIGIGINCHQKPDSFPPDLRSHATSINIRTGKKPCRQRLAARLLDALEYWIDMQKSDTRKVVEAWKVRSLHLHHRITVIHNSKLYSGNCIGLDPQDGLIIQLDHGGVRFFPAGQSSIVKE